MTTSGATFAVDLALGFDGIHTSPPPTYSH